MEMLNLVSTNYNNGLLKLIKDSKIRADLLQMNEFNALGPDGFEAAFSQDYGHII